MKKILSILIITVVFIQFNIKAQNDVQISHFMFCGQMYNPAYAGISKSFDASLLAHQQWVGFEGAPSTQILNFNTPATNVGSLGLSVINDKVGYESSINARIMYAYPVKINKNSVVIGGIGAGVINRNLDGSKLKFEDRIVADPNGIYTYSNELNPTVDFGLVFTNQKLTFGLSAVHLTKSGSAATFFNSARHYYFFGNYIIKATENLKFVPAIYAKSNLVITQIEANTNLFLYDRFWVGLSYRVNESVIGLVGLEIIKNIKLGYSYDFTTGPANVKSTGTHEIMIMTSFNTPKKENFYYKSPRLFN